MSRLYLPCSKLPDVLSFSRESAFYCIEWCHYKNTRIRRPYAWTSRRHGEMTLWLAMKELAEVLMLSATADEYQRSSGHLMSWYRAPILFPRLIIYFSRQVDKISSFDFFTSVICARLIEMRALYTQHYTLEPFIYHGATFRSILFNVILAQIKQQGPYLMPWIILQILIPVLSPDFSHFSYRYPEPRQISLLHIMLIKHYLLHCLI